MGGRDGNGNLGNGYRRCVGLALFNSAGLVFAAQRIDTPGEAWQMPQGGIDRGESPDQAALRELKEETGTDKARILAELDDWLSYDLPDEVAGRVWRGRFKGQTQKWFALAFTGTDADIDLTAHTPEFKAWRWMPLDAVARAIVAFKRPIYERVAREFAPIAARLAAESDGQKAD
jgi:putative (di)nucleoside polyphosphate hydrolase